MRKWLQITIILAAALLVGSWCSLVVEDRLGMNEPPTIQGEADSVLLSRLQPESAEQFRTRLVLGEAQRQGLPPELVLAVSRIENWGAVPTAVSSAGAIGLMQVMPFWAEFRPLVSLCQGDDLEDPRINVCFGVGILRIYYARYGSWDKALRAYNGSLRMPRAGSRYVQLVNTSLNEGEATNG